MDLDTILLNFSDKNSKDTWTLRDAVRGTQIFGGIGSGKTAGSGRAMAKTFLEKGFGGLVLCAKPEERENWQKLAAETRRSHDLIIVGEKRGYYFNPLEYENKRIDEGAGDTYNLVNLFMHIYQMGRVISGDGLASGGERFWDNALKRCLSRMIDLLKLAGEEITVENMYRLISEMLNKKELEYFDQLREGKNEDDEDRITEWAKFNYYIKCYFVSMKQYSSLANQESLTLEQEAFLLKRKKQIQITKNYFEREFANLAERTKTIVVESFLGVAEPFLSGILNEYFADKTNITPEITHKGKIVIIDFPVKRYLDAGIYAQGIFKLLWQQAVERRDFKENRDIPVFLWVDESQLFISSYDQIYQTTARSSGACTVFLTQNISNYYAAIGGKNPKFKVDSLLANLSTKVFHSNNDAVTNMWAANTIGQAFKVIEGFSIGNENSTVSGNKQYHFQVMPVEFTVLKSGKSEDKKQLEFGTVITVANRRWSDKRNYIRYTFTRKL